MDSSVNNSDAAPAPPAPPIGPPWLPELAAVLQPRTSGQVDPTAYDTAWVARVPDAQAPDRPGFPQAFDWVLAQQREDGGWGAPVDYHHDRALSTLSGCLTLALWNRISRRADWSDRVAAACDAIRRHAAGLPGDPYDTIGFELILPTLLDQARSLDLQLPFQDLARIQRMRAAKLQLISPGMLYARRTPTIFSAEFLGDQVDIQRLSALQDANGSIASSPSATAYYLLNRPTDARARAYLSRVLQRHGGAAPAVDPIDVFEPAWLLYHAALLSPISAPLTAAARPHAEALWREYQLKRGVGYNTLCAVPDLDGTAMAYVGLTWAGYDPDPAALADFEADDHFWCFPYERNPSISAHVHLLEALQAPAAFPDRERMKNKVLNFLTRTRTLQTFWFDKWHASPYYTTAHAVIALREPGSLAAEAVYWILNTQGEDGSWGYYHGGTAEETAYCIQALVAYWRGGGPAEVVSAVRRGVEYLLASRERQQVAYTPLWIGKTLYTPRWVVHSAVLSALSMAASI